MLDKKINQVKPEDLVGSLHSSSIINHNPLNPIFTLEDVPYPSVSAYSKEPLMVPEVPYETEEGF